MDSGGGGNGESRRRGYEFDRAVDLFEGLEDDPVVEEKPKPPRPPRRRSLLRGETARRILFAIPWIAFAIAITVAGGIAFAVAMIGLGLLCLREYFVMTE